MQQLTTEHVTEIVTLLQAVISEYVQFSLICAQEADAQEADTDMHTSDIVYMQACSCVFIKDKNVMQLHSMLGQQDTFVRDYCLRVFQYIESNDLIEEQYFIVIN